MRPRLNHRELSSPVRLHGFGPIGYVYAAVNAKAREVQNIDFRLFEVNGKDHDEKEQHPLLDLLDGVNPDMIGSELKYLTSAHLDIVGNCYWLLTDKQGNAVKDELTQPDAIYLLDPSKDVHFFLGDVDDGGGGDGSGAIGDGGVAPITVDATTGDIEWNSLDVDLQITNMQNSVYVIGGTYPRVFTASNTPDTFLTDGVTQFFSVAYSYTDTTGSSYPYAPLTVTLDGVLQTVGTANSTDPSTVQVLYNSTQRWIQFTNGAPASGQTVKVYGTANVPIVAHASDSDSVAEYGERQGVVSDSKIESVPEAQARATAQILQFGHPVYDVKFNTLVPGCAIGQTLNFNLSAFGLTRPLVIKRIEAVGYTPADGTPGLEYQIEAIGSDNVTFVDLMTSVLQAEGRPCSSTWKTPPTTSGRHR
jgi:hypothetical protein